MTKILNYGSLNIDYVYDVPHFLSPGETLSSASRNIFAGGKGLNQSVALSKAGGRVFHFGAVGKDDSKILTDILKDAGIDDSFLLRRDMVSGHTVIEVDPSGQNCILLFGGANQSVTEAEIDQVLESFSAGDYLVLQNETSNIGYMIEKAAARGLKVCFNVSPFEKELLNLPLEKCGCLIVNEIEGASMAGLSPDADPYILADALAAKFPKTDFVLTLGVRGSIYKAAGRAPISCKSYKVKAVDTTAAGDTFLGYLITNLSKGIEPSRALNLATAASALAVQKKGAAPSIPQKEEVEAFIRDNPAPVLTDRL